ncbi:ion transporter [Reichenbachiella sp. MALMAid0571]|uniref:ion transporter n=1 Tax=Reichenbachiella sp. MALMAid0571 TaxID=3143939 RepID=UPI0032DEA8A8
MEEQKEIVIVDRTGKPGGEPDDISLFQQILLWLSIYVVIELYISSIITYPDKLKEVLELVDFGICMLFLYDFASGIIRAENKWKYFRIHWIDLISSIPTVDILRAGRLVRIIRILRVLRSAKYVFTFFSRQNSFNSFKNLIILSCGIILLFTLSFHHLEKNVNPHINSIGDSLWWTTITTITVGFLQDIPPMTPEGKFLSVALILLGMVMFSTLTGTITDFFIEDEDIVVKLNEMTSKVESLESKIDSMSEKIDKLNKS